MVVDEGGPGYELAIDIQVKDRFFVCREHMVNEICFCIRKIFSLDC